jgi:hypothetical protein
LLLRVGCTSLYKNIRGLQDIAILKSIVDKSLRIAIDN